MTTPADDESFLEPFDRQPGEPGRAFALFGVYRDLGARRSLKAACRQFYGADFNPGKLRNSQLWSSRWEWVKRVAAWDSHLDRQGRFAQAEQVKELNRRYANSAKAFLSKALQGLAALKPDELDASDITRMAELAHKIERLCHGQATEHTRSEVKTDGTFTLEVVERLVPIRTDVTAPPPALPSAAGDDADIADAEFSLPDEPPPALASDRV